MFIFLYLKHVSDLIPDNDLCDDFGAVESGAKETERDLKKAQKKQKKTWTRERNKKRLEEGAKETEKDFKKA